MLLGCRCFHGFPQMQFFGCPPEVIADSEPPPPPVELSNPEAEVFSESFLYFSIPNQDEKHFRLREFWCGGEMFF